MHIQIFDAIGSPLSNPHSLWQQSSPVVIRHRGCRKTTVTRKTGKDTRLFVCAFVIFLLCTPLLSMSIVSIPPSIGSSNVSWPVDPFISNQTHSMIINITHAYHLDSHKNLLADISATVKGKDGIWSEPIKNGEYVRVTFENPLQAINDITIVARSKGVSRIDVTTKGSDVHIATFKTITSEGRYQVFLTNLSGCHTTFDLLTTGDAVEYEFIVDPSGWISPTGATDPSGQWTYESRVYDENTGSYAYHAGAIGWRGFLELNLSSSIYCDRIRVFSDFDTYYVDKVSIDIYNSTSWIEKYNGTISDCTWTEVEFSGETNVTKARFRYHYIRGSVQLWFYEFDFWQGQPHTLPNGTTLNATSIDETTAILKGNISDDGGEPCEYRFQYGLDTLYGINTSWGGSEARGSEFGTMIHNLMLGTTYQFRVQVRNDMGVVNGSNNNFTTTPPTFGWVTPTSFYDVNSQWTNEYSAFDDDVDTYTQSYHDINDPDGQWSFYIYLNHSSMYCDKVRFYARGPTGDPTQVDQVDLDVKRGGAWIDVYQGTFSDKQWVEKGFMQGSVNQARIRFRVNVNNGGLYYQLYEFDFNNSRPVPMIFNESPVNRTWGISLKPQMTISIMNPDGAPMTITWASNSSGSWQPFGTNSSVGNGTYYQTNMNFSSNNTKYWWRVTVTDGTDSNTSWFSFSTPDLLKPSSNVVAITPYWKKSSTTVTVTATDTGWSGLKNVTLYSRFSGDNASWNAWVRVGVDTASPWSWTFIFPNGTGYYQFYSIAADNSSNNEAAPGIADTRCGYDIAPPTSSVDKLTFYWVNAATTLTASASDATSGVKNVTLWYRFSTSNSTWGGYVRVGVDTLSPWSWSFSYGNGSGFYQFYSIAKDYATNEESIPGGADTWVAFENQPPSSAITSISSYWISSTPLILTAIAADTGLSGLKNVTLYYSYRATNATSWGGNISFSTDHDPWTSCSWSFSFPNGVGHYRFYSIATDNATNTELAPGGSSDTLCGYNTAAPISNVVEITPYWTSTVPLMINVTAVDAGPSGLKNVTLYYYTSSDNNSWTGPWIFGVDTDPWISCSWDFTFPNTTGYYRFYSCAVDNSSHVENPPLFNDTLCGYDAISPLCSISYNRSSESLKASDALKIYVNFTESHSGMNDTNIQIAIFTLGNGSLSNESMQKIDNTHWYYDWIIPSGVDDDGPFTVHIYATDNVSHHLDPYPTLDTSKEIDNTPPVQFNLSVDGVTTNSVVLSWMTNENTTSRIEYGLTQSYGYWYNDASYGTNHLCTIYGLSPATTYSFRVRSFDAAGNQAMSINDIFTTAKPTHQPGRGVYLHENTPPIQPTISGSTHGSIDQMYQFVVRSSDADNDLLFYTFTWGDGIIETTDMIPSGMSCYRNHSWANPGRYTITITASDMFSSTESETIIWIDTEAVINLGYLVDNDSDQIYDVFHNNITGRLTTSELKDGSYLIDVDGDQCWDYMYNTTTGRLLLIAPQPSRAQQASSPLLLVIGLFLLVFSVFLILGMRRWFHRR